MKGILIFARVPMNVVCLRPMYRALQRKFSFWGTSKTPEGRQQRHLFSELGIEARYIPPWLASWLPLSIYLSSDIMLVGKRCKWKIHTFHGVSFKGRAYTERVLAYDRLFIIGPYMERRFVQKGILKDEDPRIVQVGMPKLDALMDGTWSPDRAREYIGIQGKAPVVLYAPTWGAGSSLDAMGDKVVNVALGMGLSLVVKLHDHSWKDNAWRQKAREWAERGAVVFRGPDVVPAMAASDVLISDLSSVANEYLLLDRPIIYAVAPDYEKRYGHTIDLKSWGFSAGPLVNTERELFRALRESLDCPEAYSEVRRAMALDLFYNPGRATQKAVEVITALF